MKMHYRLSSSILALAFTVEALAQTPVPLPCEPNCTIDPCKLAPERCRPTPPPPPPPPVPPPPPQ